MNLGETLYVTNRGAWRKWLKKNHKSKKEIWLIYYKKHTRKPRIAYDDAVEEAICYGWIDSTVKKLDEERYAQKYTPRNANSIWSDSNITRAKKMIAKGRMTKYGLALFNLIGEKASKAKRIPKKYRIPKELKIALARNRQASQNFHNFAPSYQKMYIYWILDAKKQETRQRRIQRVVEFATRNKKSVML